MCDRTHCFYNRKMESCNQPNAKADWLAGSGFSSSRFKKPRTCVNLSEGFRNTQKANVQKLYCFKGAMVWAARIDRFQKVKIKIVAFVANLGVLRIKCGIPQGRTAIGFPNWIYRNSEPQIRKRHTAHQVAPQPSAQFLPLRRHSVST